MRQSGRTTLFVLVCIAVLCAAYGAGLGIRKLRMAGLKINISVGGDTKKTITKSNPPSKPETKPTGDVAATVPKPANREAPVAEPSANPPETPSASADPTNPGIKQAQRQNLSAAGQQQPGAQRRRGGGRSRGGGRNRAAYQQLSEEDRNSLRDKMEALRAKAADMSEEEMRQARSDILEQYGINPQAGGARRPGGRQ